ncbi:apolipoprotein N-acyltransferase [Croceibacterium ferulae]|uniref:apolipoprotein N-acyltransferase n=1 Tax=Croceibacterium ferulae TaxID=1854641 RepID=UPI000EB26D94|nr:apolipoprotein N-acyltransferase [Croceibacterium ferulae]
MTQHRLDGRAGSAASLALGVLAATGFEPLHWWPVALVAMGLFATLVARTASVGRAGWLGWLFGLGYFTFGNNWIATAFTHQAQMPAVLGWAAVPLLAVYLAVYPAMAALGGRAIAGAGRHRTVPLAFAGCWIGSELLRASVFTGYSWNPFAMVLLGPWDRPGLAMLSPWMGTYALSGLAVLLSVMAAEWALRRRFVPAAGVALVVAAGMLLPGHAGPDGALPVTVVQPNLPQARLGDPRFFEANYLQLASLSPAARPGPPRLVLWPESGLADYLRPGYPQRFYDSTTALGSPDFARRRIGRTIGAGSLLLTGAVDLEVQDGRAVGAYNSVTALDADGTIRGSYAKAHLVPYGEYLPMREVLEPLGLSRLVPGAIDFLSGPGPRTLALGEYGRAGVQICYEIVFSGEVADRRDRPDYIFNPSNDGWFGAFGPPQHLAQARMRAIEEGLPVLRSTTTGISAVIDARGIVRQHLATGVAGRMDMAVPAALPPTLFARVGNMLAFAWALIFLGLALVAVRRTRP